MNKRVRNRNKLDKDLVINKKNIKGFSKRAELNPEIIPAANKKIGINLGLVIISATVIAVILIFVVIFFGIQKNLSISDNENDNLSQDLEIKDSSNIPSSDQEETNNDLTNNQTNKSSSGNFGGGGGGGSGGGSSSSSDDNITLECVPNCSNKTCGEDGCGGSCGSCDSLNECNIGSCLDYSCVYETKSNGAICSEGICSDGTCVSCTSNLECNDNINCTVDSCSSGKCTSNPNNNYCSNGAICSPLEGCVNVSAPQNLLEVFNRIDRNKEKSLLYGLGNNSVNVSLLEDPSNNYLWQPETLMYRDLQTGHEVWRMTNSPNGFSVYFTDIGVDAWSADGKYLSLETVGRPTKSRNNYDTWYKQFSGEMIVGTNGNSFRFLTNSSSRGNHWAFAWSPQIPDTYYDFGNPLGYPWNDPKNPQTDTLYKNVVTENGIYWQPIFDSNVSNLGIGKLISADGRKILAIGVNRTVGYFAWFYPIIIYPDDKAGFDIDKNINPYQGYPSWRNLPNYAGTDNLNQSKYLDPAYANRGAISGHDRYYAGDGQWFYWMVPTSGLSGAAWWRLKVLGSADDGGAYSDNSNFPVSDVNYDFGEAWPENHATSAWYINVTNVTGSFITSGEYLNYSVSGSKNRLSTYNITSGEMRISFYYTYSHPFKAPQVGEIVTGTSSGAKGTVGQIIYGPYPSPFVADTTDYYNDKTCYWSHFVPDRWGRYSLFSSVCDKLPGSFINGTGQNYGTGTWDIQNHVWSVPTFGGGATHHDWHGFTDFVVSSSGQNKLYAGIYDDNKSQFLVTNPYNKYFNGTSYSAITRPTQSPDGTKLGFHSEFLNGKDRTDSFWAVVAYPYPPVNLSSNYNGGVKISFLPPKYTERGWPFANDTLNKLRNGGWPQLDSNGNEIGEPVYAREIKKFHIWRATSQGGPWNEVGNVDYLQNYLYTSSEDPHNELMMLHPVDSNGLKISPTNKISFTDPVNEGTYYYAITSEEHSGLESDGLSEIIQVVVSGGNVINSQVVQSKGQKDFWRTKPASPNNFFYVVMNESSYYNLSWDIPNDNKIRFFNIYYSNKSNPSLEQKNRIASIPANLDHFIDYAADPSTQGYYGITSVDRYGNEGDIIYQTEIQLSSLGIFATIRNLALDTLEKIGNFFVNDNKKDETINQSEDSETIENKIDNNPNEKKNLTIYCIDNDQDNFSSREENCGILDCNDNNSLINTSFNEICNNFIDDNCNNLIDCEDSYCKNDASCIIDEIKNKSQEKIETSDFKIPLGSAAYWKFDDNLIDEVSKESFNMYTWVQPKFREGKLGSSVILDPSIHKDYSVVISKRYDMNNGFSYLGWFYLNNLTNKTWSGHGFVREWIDENNSMGFGVRTEGLPLTYKIIASVNKKGNFTSLSTPKYTYEEFPYKNKWFHGAFIWNTSSAMFYINGELIDMKESSSEIQDNFGIYLIGQGLNGSVDEFMVYNRGLSEKEIKDIYCLQGGDC